MGRASSQSELYDEFTAQVRQVINDALRDGTEPRIMAYSLLELSHEIARTGGPVVCYDHAHMMRNEARDLLAELSKAYGAKLAPEKRTDNTDTEIAIHTRH